MKNNKKKGFTLVELIIVIVIIGILAAVLIPQITSYIKKAKISKGVQNARNVSTFVMSELILNDKDTYFPNEVVKLCMDNGYNLKSELDDYAYWYDTEQNIIVYKEIDEMCVNADNEYAGLGRGRIECISAVHPELYYVDQQDNAIKNAIDTVNNLVTYGMAIQRPSSVSEDKWATFSYKMKVIYTMDSLLQEAVKKVSKMKLSSSNLIKEFVGTFTPLITGSGATQDNGTVYYSDYGVFNEAMELGKGTSDEISVTRAVVNDGTKTIVTDLEYESIDLTIELPLLITPEVKAIDDYTVKTLVDATFYCSSNTSYNSALLSGSASIKGLETLSNVTYTLLNVNPSYSLAEYRFTNGLMISLAQYEVNGNNINYEVSQELVTYAFTYDTDKTVYLPVVKKTVNDVTSYRLFKAKEGNKFYDFHGGYVEYAGLVITLGADNQTISGISEFVTDLRCVGILSKYLVPTVAIVNGTAGEAEGKVDFTQFVSINAGGATITGNMSVRLTNEIASVKYNAVLVDNNLKGYLIDNIGYILDVDMTIDQLTKDVMVNSEEQQVVIDRLTIHGNTESTINFNLPKEARGFTNYSGAEVNIYYDYEYVEFIQTTIGDGSKIWAETGNRFLANDSVEQHKVSSIFNGSLLQLSVNDLASHTYTYDSVAHQCNQIKVSKVEIIKDGKVLFERYYY